MYNFFMPRGDDLVARMLNKLGHKVSYALPAEGGAPLDAAIFTGGYDVSPLLYGEIKNNRTICDMRTDRRDLWAYHNISLDLPKVGICRGAQFLNVMSGGSLYQHVSGHDRGSHEAQCLMTNEVISVSSTHHQMMIPNNSGFVMMEAQESEERWRENNKIDVSKDCDIADVEVVFYPNTESLCFQPHPEFTDSRVKPTLDYFVYCMETMVYPTMLKNKEKRLATKS